MYRLLSGAHVTRQQEQVHYCVVGGGGPEDAEQREARSCAIGAKQ